MGGDHWREGGEGVGIVRGGRGEGEVAAGQRGVEELEFDFGDLGEFPGDVGDFFDEDVLDGGDGAEFFLEFFVGLEEGGVGVVGGLLGGEAVGFGVLRDGLFALGCAGACGFFGVVAVGGEAFFGEGEFAGWGN